MNSWWVNHKQTFRHEFLGKYIWSPKLKKNGAVNPFYETMREVSPGDVVFSFANGLIQGFGVARTHCYTSPQPDEFGHIGHSWHHVGWRVDVDFVPVVPPVKPSLHMAAIGPTLPSKYSPISLTGLGYQGVYLARVPQSMALVLASLASPELVGLINGTLMQESSTAPHDSELKGIVEWEHLESQKIITNESLSETERAALIKARRGQGLFRQRVSQIEYRCRITGVANPEHLIASHIKPWRESNNVERLATANGLLLTPTVDHLFDRGFISFENDGELIVSPIAHLDSLNRMGIVTSRKVQVGSFVDSQKEFLEFHRSEVFLKSA